MPSWQLHLRNEDWERWTKQPSLAGIDGVKPALGTASCLQHVPVKKSARMAVLYMCEDNFSLPDELNHFHDLRSTLSTILGPNTIPLQPFGFDSMQQCCKVSGLRAASTLAWYICKRTKYDDFISLPYQILDLDYHCSDWVDLFVKMICWTWATATFFCLLSSIQYVDHASELLVIIDTRRSIRL